MISMIPARSRSELLDVNHAFCNALWADVHLNDSVELEGARLFPERARP